MKRICNEVLQKAKVPKTWLEANITLIPKEEADLTQIENFRPISLLNVDYKIFATIMADRLKKFLMGFIQTDQNRFLLKSQLRYNLRIIMGILEYYEVHPGKQMALLLLDAQKAFDNVNWKFMLEQLKIMEFGQIFLRMIEATYKEQIAKVIINGDTIEKIEMQKGTRQGCPLSPLLFILT